MNRKGRTLLVCLLATSAACGTTTVTTTPADASPYKRCPNGTYIRKYLTCPASTPTPTPSPTPTPTPTPTPIPTPTPTPTPTPISTNCPSITNTAWQNGGPMKLADEICPATKACNSLWQNANTIAAGITLPTTIIGMKYYVNPLINGLMPDGYVGGAVNAVPIDGSGTQQMKGDWQFDQSCFQ